MRYRSLKVLYREDSLPYEERVEIIAENNRNRERSRQIRLEAQLKALEEQGIKVENWSF